MEIGPAGEGEKSVADWKKEAAGLGQEGGFKLPTRCLSRLHSVEPKTQTASAYVRWDAPNIGKESTSGKGLDGLCTVKQSTSKRFQHHKQHDHDQQYRRYLIDNSIEFSRTPVLVGGKILNPTGKESVQG
jgi:hypothetical protein